MSMSVNRETFLTFLVTAKQHTYAMQGGNASAVSPLVPGSKQLEYQEAALLYRDIYFGGDYFVGQETVYYESTPVWAMNYAGGKLKNAEVQVDVKTIYAFLQAALREIPRTQPYRGPAMFRQASFSYINESHGDIDRFWGWENITYQGVAVYQLHYSGGILQV
ncbi:MAG: hypothetical protein JXR84_12880 [Anaerolineae bacterium]|nr:hypothetical protein [Anaerolineae bacterium]